MSETKRDTVGFRAFSVTEEDTYGTSETITHSITFEGGFMQVKPGERQDNSDEITGYENATKDQILTTIGSGSHTKRLLPHEAALFFAACMGKVTQDQPDNVNAPNTYRHWIERELTLKKVKALTMIESNGATQNLYNAVIAKSVKISSGREGFARIDVDLMSRGSEEDNAASKPAPIALENYLRYGDINFMRGGSLTGTIGGGDLAHSGGSSLKGDLRSFEAAINNDAKPIYEMGDSTGFVTRFERGDRFQHSLSTVIDFQNDSDRDAMIAGTEYVVSIPLIGPTIEDAQKYTVELIFPKVIIEDVDKGKDGKVLTSSIIYKVMEDTTFGTMIVKVINKEQGYLG